MADLNNWNFTGRLTKDANYTVLASGKGVLNMDVAVNTGYGDYKKTTFAKVQMWGERGSNVQPFLKKGSLIGANGRIELNEWEGNDGTKRSQIIVTVSDVQILSSKKDDDHSDTQPAGNEEPVF